MEARKLALVACIGSVSGMIMPLWADAHRFAYLIASHGVTGSQWFVIPLTLLTTLITAIMPLFYFALFRDKGNMQFSKALRKVALLAAVALVIVMAVRVETSPNPLNWVGVLGLLRNLTYILPLVAMSREPREEAYTQ